MVFINIVINLEMTYLRFLKQPGEAKKEVVIALFHVVYFIFF